MSKQNPRPIEQYDHKDKTRANNPPVGLVDTTTDPREVVKTYAYDQHLDPQLHWAGKKERNEFKVPTVSLHVHERIDPRTILDAVKKKSTATRQMSLFETLGENPPLHKALDFYKHAHGWSNRLIAGDSLLVMNSLLEKEGMSGQVQTIYLDPPYGVKFGSNFQPFVNKRDVTDGRDEDLTQEPEMVQAFRDTWECEVHSYLSYLRERLFLCRELLNSTGSLFLQISDRNLHHAREVLDEVFDSSNFCAIIAYKTTGALGRSLLESVTDYVLWYAKDKSKVKYRQLYERKSEDDLARSGLPWMTVAEDGTPRSLTLQEKRDPSQRAGLEVFLSQPLTSQHHSPTRSGPYEFRGETYHPSKDRQWSLSTEELDRLAAMGRIIKHGRTIRYKAYLSDYPVVPIKNIWEDTPIGGYRQERLYAVQTPSKVISRCILMTSDPGDLVLDPTCGSGTTAFLAEQWGRRWITCDTSRVAVAIARQRLMTSLHDYYALAHPSEGIAAGFRYEEVSHLNLKSIASGGPAKKITLVDSPLINNDRVRVTGPFTIEAVPAPVVEPLEEPELAAEGQVLSRAGPTGTQAQWRTELQKTGIRGKSNQHISFARLESQPGTRWIHAVGETSDGKSVAVSFGPDHAPLEQRQVELAWQEAKGLTSKPSMLIFAAFQFDPEASKDIENMPANAGMTFLKAQMNTDLLTEDLKKKRSSNESFWLIGQPDVVAKKRPDGKYVVEVRGFDYYNVKTGMVESGGVNKIATWALDHDYDNRSLFPHQVFFPMAGANDGWARLAKALNVEIDEEKIEAFRGSTSLPFEIGSHKRIAVKIVDDRGIESLKVIDFGSKGK